MVPSGREVAALRRSLLEWYEAGGRSLAIRAPGIDPWGVLVAEVMAQQTQIGRVEQVWRVFLDRFPAPADLAAASPADAIRAWRGLGYNRRALDLHQAAAAIVAAGGRVPADPRALQALPGVGPYTARAVAAIAFGRPVGAVDVNVRRVLGRMLAGGSAALGRAHAQAAADRLVDRRRPVDWNHAMMDVGAIVCRPASPACPDCPLRRWCRAAGDAALSGGGHSRPAPREGTPRTTTGQLACRCVSRRPPAGCAAGWLTGCAMRRPGPGSR